MFFDQQEILAGQGKEHLSLVWAVGSHQTYRQ